MEILKSNKDDLVANFQGSFIEYNFKKDLTRVLKGFGSDITLYLDKTDNEIDQSIQITFNEDSEDNTYFSRVYNKLKKSIN